MPVYEVVSKELLEEWLSYLNCITVDLYKNPTKSGICYFMINLYEFAQVLCNYRLREEKDGLGIKVTVTNIKDYVSEKELNKIINKFMGYRNDIAHGVVSDDYFSLIIQFLGASDFKKLLLKLNLDSVLYSNLLNLLSRLKVCFTQEYSSHCIEECRNYLRPINGKSTYTVEDTVVLLKDKYDDVTINNTLRIVLSSNYVTE